MSKDYYKSLGVSETATDDEIKSAFRKLAKQYHPDRNKGDSQAEERFKEISEAYDVLKDKKKRQQYDTMRKYGAFTGGPSFDPRHSGGFDASQFERFFRFDSSNGADAFSDLFSTLFGGRPSSRQGPRPRRRQRVKGQNAHVSLTISFMESVRGTEKMIIAKNPGAQLRRRKIKVKIPAGIENGGKVRLRGMGFPSETGSVNGDLKVTVSVEKNEQFDRRGNDIYTKINIPYPKAVLGGKVEVKTLSKTISMSLPPGTKPGTKLRLKGMGLSVDGKNGDQYVEVVVDIPEKVTDKQKELLEELAKTME